MYFVPCKLSGVKMKGERTDIRKLLEQIERSGNACVELKDYTHVSAKSCQNSLSNRIVKDRLTHLKVVTRGERVFVINMLRVKEVN